MIELETVELVPQLADFLTVRSHLGIVVARLLHDLVDDQLGVTLDVEASDAQLDGDAHAIDERLIFGHIIGGESRWDLDACNTLGVCHQLSNGFELKHDMSSGNEGVKIKST